ncbi:MAG: hypothetical protein U9R37_00955 [Campylobacterota bacterium]|nr:hypothetical protein [Campylobacterota bacterium]
MERRDWSLKALKDLKYIDSLEANQKAILLERWVNSNLSNENKIEDFDLELNDLKNLAELFYKNISFLKDHRIQMKDEIEEFKKIREFLV